MDDPSSGFQLKIDDALKGHKLCVYKDDTALEKPVWFFFKAASSGPAPNKVRVREVQRFTSLDPYGKTTSLERDGPLSACFPGCLNAIHSHHIGLSRFKVGIDSSLVHISLDLHTFFFFSIAARFSYAPSMIPAPK
jgi:hypothetical protein